jgi:hypothetical protein
METAKAVGLTIVRTDCQPESHQSLGIKIPQSILVQATKVIE